MDLKMMADNAGSKEDFIRFLKVLQADLAENKGRWENANLENYLEGMEAFLTDSTEQSQMKVDFSPSWSLFANMMLVASIYE
ncbi:MAG: hypothetical protein P0Y53_16215 [Candidatus Pseudobacter hemicellulosilyticus]|uniref:DUF7660 domain-containing protein n=1 Tax=Candidatus Pseudobacter hemicellulosilyticus TaxID=3121375 RepID=A0AAJ5WQU9_9BACT|nr:MAG: hypothetical protein P0Y53_16215 [Pseudobacter sp.]